jgi:hypothetical protein
MNMFVPDMPNVPDQYLPVIVAEARPMVAASPNKNMTFGVCQLVPNLSYVPVGGEHALNPASVAVADLWRFDEHFRQMPEDQRREALLALEKTAKVTILQQPTYGTLSDTARDYPDATPDSPYYNPKPGYLGKDQVIFLVEMGEYKIKLIFNVYPVAGSSEDPKAIEKLCGKRGTYYKISSASEQLSALLSSTDYSLLLTGSTGVAFNFANLPSAAVGQTVGSTITLDTNAAGYNWFIDATPADNSEYLATGPAPNLIRRRIAGFHA